MMFNAKSLTYEARDPTFLRKLKNEYLGHDEAQDRRPEARPKKQESRDDEDDEPIYIDEETQNPVSINEYKALLISHEAKPSTNRSLPSSSSSSSSTSDSRNPQAEIPTIDGIKSVNSTTLSQQREASIGVNSKKRLARVIGSGHEEAKGKNIRKRNAKKVKLCFDENAESQ